MSSSTSSSPRPTRTTLGPLTTAFTPAADCSPGKVRLDRVDEDPHLYWGRICAATATDDRTLYDGPSCYPPGLVPSSSSYRGSMTMTFFSPGISCPQGWTTACTLARSDDGDAPSTLSGADRSIWRQLWVGETAVGCCPNGYVCDKLDYFRCASTGTPGQVLTGLAFDYGCKTTTVAKTVTQTTDSPVATAIRVQMLLPGPTRTGGPPQPTFTPSGSKSNKAAEIAIPVAGAVVMLLIIALFLYVGWLYSTEEERKQGWFKMFLRGIGVSRTFQRYNLTSNYIALRHARGTAEGEQT